MDNAQVQVVKEVVFKTSQEAEPLLEAIGIKPEVYNRIALNALMRTPALANCNPASLRQALLTCAERGLMPDGESCAIVPFKKKVAIIPMIGGMLDMAREAIPGLSVRLRVIYQGEHYEYEERLKTHLVHKPLPVHEWGESAVVAAYAVGWQPGASEPEVEFMYRDEIERFHRAFSRAGEDSPWHTQYERMCQKTVGRSLLNRYPVRAGLLKRGRPADTIDDVIPPDGEREVIDITPQPAQPQPAQPQPAQPQPAQPQPAQPQGQPAQPQGQPAQPQGQPAQPQGQPAQPQFQPSGQDVF